MKQASEAPPIYVDGVPCFFDDFWGEIFWSATDGGGCLFVGENFGESKVCEFDVPYAIDDDIFWF